MDVRSESATPVWKTIKVATSSEITTHKEESIEEYLSLCAQSTQSRIAKMTVSQNNQLTIVKVTCNITLAMKRSIKIPRMTETAVTTCGVTIFEMR